MSREEEIYATALDVPLTERAAFLERECDGDAALRARVEALLIANDEADRFFTLPMVPRPPPIPEEQPGDRIGRYKLLQKIGEGGCGVVYMAEQQEPVRRRVALKVIKLGMDTKAVIARFEAERQALALMDHPNIARVLDAGATETGRPFFVMELVRGMPITRYCDAESLSTKERLQLFVQVCHAIQHAHQKGIIHRDIKPTNILVTMHDDVAVPKVIDFGIAKATQGRLTDHSVFTAFEQFIGTPAYMSPEQAQLTDLEVDARSDIYSLGVLLYELLTGRPPFDPKALHESGLDEIRRIIREVDPPRPSTRLSTLGEADREAVARRRATAPAQLSGLLRGDLDWIVMRALEKNRTRRYETASGLAADVNRHLTNEPVVARPPSAAYRFQKFTARNKFALIAGAAAALSLVAGLTLSQLVFRERPAQPPTEVSATPRAAPATPREPGRMEKAGPAGIPTVQALLSGTDTPAPPRGLTSRIVLIGAGYEAYGELSPDETRVAYVDWDGVNSADLFVKTLGTGAVKQITSFTPAKPKDYTFADDPTWSPDSQWIAYNWWLPDQQNDLRMTSFATGETRIVRPYEPNLSYYAWDWSSDGAVLLCMALKQKERTRDLVSVSVATGEVRHLLPWNMERHPRLSPDGRYVAFARKVGVKSAIHVFALATGAVVRLNDLPTEEDSPIWSGDGRTILYSSDRRGTWDLWAVRVAGGKPVAAPFLVKSDIGNPTKRRTARGHLVFNNSHSESDASVVEVNPNGPVRLSRPKPIARSFLGRTGSPTWSPDGKRVAYFRNQLLCVQVLEDGREAAIDIGMRRIMKAFWSPDGQWIAMAPGGPRFFGLHAYNLQTQELRPLHSIKGEEGVSDSKPVGWTDDSRRFVLRLYPATEPRYAAIDLEGKSEHLPAPAAPQPVEYSDVSPDGARIAYVVRRPGDGSVLLLVSDRAFKEPKTIADLGSMPKLGTMEGRNSSAVFPRWSPDGRMIAYYANNDKIELHVVAADGAWNHTVVTGELKHYVMLVPPAWSPDSTKLGMTLVGASNGEIAVLENFLPQERPVSLASAQGIVAQTSAGARTAFAIRQVPLAKFPGTWGAAGVSPDGRHFLYHGDGNQITLFDVESQSLRKLGQAKLGVRFSGDSRQVALLNGDREHGGDLRILNLDGTEARTVAKFTAESLDYIWLHAWAADGRQFAVVTKKDKAYGVALINAASGALRALRSTGAREPGRMSFSPDGRWLVYDVAVDDKGMNSDLFVVDVATGIESSLVQHQADDRLMGWSPTSDAVLFASNRRGNFDAWLIDCVRGKPSGEVRLVKSDLGEPEPVGFTQSGAFYFAHRQWVQDVFTLAIEPGSGRARGEPVKAIEQFEGTNSAASWSPDGRKLAYSSRRPPFVIRVLEAETQQDRLVAEGLYGPKWSPDGKSLLCFSQWDGEEKKLYLVDVATGSRAIIDDGKPTGSLYRAYQWAPEGGAIFYEHGINEKPWTTTIVRRELATGREREIQRADNAGFFAVSPDGRSLVFRASGKLHLVPIAGGEPKVIYEVPKGRYIPGWDMFTWSADGRAVMVGVWQINRQAERMPDSITSELVRVPVDGGTPEVVMATPRVRYPHAHPDGTRITFSAGQPRLELWVMENFLREE